MISCKSNLSNDVNVSMIWCLQFFMNLVPFMIECLCCVQVEYDVEESCSSTSTSSDGCVDNLWSMATMPTGGYVVYGVAHQHTGGLGSTLYGEVFFFSTHSNLVSARPYNNFLQHVVEPEKYSKIL